MSMKVNSESMTDSLEDSINVSMLLELYAPLLTQRQLECVTLYFNEDLSLAEIAEISGITRQGVRDCIRKGVAILHETEKKLNLLAKREAREILYHRISAMLQLLADAHPECTDEIAGIQAAMAADVD